MRESQRSKRIGRYYRIFPMENLYFSAVRGSVLTVSDFRRNLAATNCLGSEQGKPGLILGFEFQA